jgi:hypothetical protein
MTEVLPTCYVLFAGTDPRRTDLSHQVLGRFATEEDARQAFLAVRLSPTYQDGWAELVGVDSHGRRAPLCWFGHRSPPARARWTHREAPRTSPTRDVHVAPKGGAMKTQERPGTTVPAPQLERPRPRWRARTVAAVVTAVAAATLAIAAITNDGPADAPSEPPVAPVGQVVPGPRSGGSEGIHSVDG